MSSSRPPWRRRLHHWWMQVVLAWQSFWWRIQDRFAGLGRWWRRSTFRSILALPLVPFRYLTFGTGKLLYHWWMTRSLRLLVQGLPAILFLIGVGVLLFLVVVQPGWRLVEVYEQAGQQAYRDADYNEANICFERLSQLAPENQRFRYLLGQVAEKRHELDRAVALIAVLAPRDHMGYAPAHLWEARRLMSITPPTAANREAAEAHAIRVVEAEPNNSEAVAILAQIYLDTDRVAQAEQRLSQVGKNRPDLRLQLARVYSARGDLLRASAEAAPLVDLFRKQVEQRPDDHTARLGWADALVLIGNFPAAEQVLRNGMTLFPSGPFPISLAWMYRRWADSLDRVAGSSVELRLRLYRDTAALLEQHGPDNAANHAQLYRLYLLLGDSDRAMAHLLRAVDELPQLRLDLARLYESRSIAGKAREEALRAREEFRVVLERDPANSAARLLASDAEVVLKDFPAAVRLLEEGWNKSRQPVYTFALNRTYLAWWGSLSEREQEQQLDLVRSAFRYNPWNLDGWRRVLLLCRSSPALAEQVQTMLREMLAKGEAPAAIHLVLGTDALEQGKLLLARQHLEQAYRLDPRRVETANNFAWVLGQVEPPELDRALRVVNDALERFPNQANLRDTRGRLYCKQKKWKEALADLEAVLPLFRGNPGLHEALADCYDQLGQKDLAAEHRGLAAQARRTP